MKLYYNKNLCLFIPSKILYLKNDVIIVKLNKNILLEDKNKLFNVNDISNIELKLKHFNDDKKLIVIKDFIYNFSINKNIYEDKTYHITKKPTSIFNNFSKMVNSCWFINSL